MKKLFCLLLVIMLIGNVFVACGKDEAANDQKPQVTNPPKQEINQTEPKGTDDIEIEVTEPEESLDTSSLINEARYIAGDNTGYAWILIDDVYCCVSAADGSVTATLSGDYEPVSYIYNGYSLISDGKPEHAVLVNYKGEEVFSAQSLGATGIVVYRKQIKGALGTSYEHTLENGYLEAGYLLVYKVTEAFDGVKYELGVVDLDGNWTYPLSASHPIFTATCKGRSFDASETNILCKIIYAGENKVVFQADPWGSFGIYDLIDHSVATVYYDDCHAEFDEGLYFHNGIAAYTYDSGVGGLETISVNGDVTKVINTTNGFAGNRYINGDDAFCPISSNVFSTETNGFGSACYLWNLKGELIKEYTQYDMTFYDHYLNGCVPAKIVNSEGSNYVTLVDERGEFVFEPIKHSDYMTTITYFDGNYFVANAAKANTVYDCTGKLLGEVDEYSVEGLNNGILKLKYWDGEIVYMTPDELFSK